MYHNEESIPEMVSISDSTSLSSRQSDSIEIVSSSDLCCILDTGKVNIRRRYVVIFVNQICNWSFLLFFSSHNKEANGSRCQQTITDIEIENLADTFNQCMVDKQNWLSPSYKKVKKNEISVAKV